MEVPVCWWINNYGQKIKAFQQLLPSNESKESFAPLITYQSSSNKTRFMFKSKITPKERTCVYMLRDSKLTNVTPEHREGRTKQLQAFPFQRSGKSPKRYDPIFLS